MSEVSYAHFFSVFLASALYLTSYFYEYKGELDFASFYYAKVNSMMYSETFPKNKTENVQLLRDMYLSSRPPHPDNFSIGVMDVHTDIFGENQPKQLMRIYNSNLGPNTADDPDEQRDIILWLHDGSWMLGDVSMDDDICFKLAKGTGYIVISASYRLAPEHRYPTPLDDSLNALRWVSENAESYGGHKMKLLVAGAGAGGNLAAAIVAKNLDLKVTPIEERVSVIGLMLVYPSLASLDVPTHVGSYEEYDNLNGFMTTRQLFWAKRMYRCGQKLKPNDYGFAPLTASMDLLKLFPNTVILLARHDILADDGHKLHDLLQSRYVPVNKYVYNSTIYGFFGHSEFPLGDVAMADACRELVKIGGIYPASFFIDEGDTGGALPPFPDEWTESVQQFRNR